MSVRSLGSGRLLAAVAGICAAATGSLAAPADDRFPEPRPADRVQAAALVAGPADDISRSCLTGRMAEIGQLPYGGGGALRRALTLLRDWRSPLPDERIAQVDEFRVRYSTAADAADLVPADLDGNRRPDRVDVVLAGLGQARALFSELGLPLGGPVETLLVDLGGAGGYLLPATPGDSPTRMVLDVGPRADAEATRHAAIHQYAHAVAAGLSAEFPAGWGCALAAWAELAVDGTPGPARAGALSERLRRLDEGLFPDDPVLAAGNAIWLSFIDEAYGRHALRAMVLELARDPSSPAAAFERALRQAAGDSLRAAFREFQLWAVLVGERADRHHWPFASALASTGFASATDALPALSVQADPAVAPWGAAEIRLRAGDARGGMRVRFEGDFGGSWEADLLLVGRDGTKRRVPLELEGDYRGETAVPLGDLAEALLLVRHVTADDRTPRRYTWAAHGEPDYPFELAALEARPAPAGGVTIYWETSSEQDLVGFNVLRVREKGGRESVVNGIWVPALGDATNATGYQFLDDGAAPGVSYVYRVQGVTRSGLTSDSEPVLFRPPPAR